MGNGHTKALIYELGALFKGSQLEGLYKKYFWINY